MLKTYIVEYVSNNSGGSWWLQDGDWRTLEKEGWKVKWFKDQPKADFMRADAKGRWLGALATSATIEVEAYSESLAEGVAEMWWEEALPYDAKDAGCNCCGTPHNFYAREKE